MSDKVIYSDGGWTNTLLIIIVIVVVAVFWFLFATGRLWNTSNPQQPAKTMDVNVNVPNVPWTTTTSTSTSNN